MLSHRHQTLAITLLALCTLLATGLAGIVVLGMRMTPWLAIAALAASAALVAGAYFVHDALRAARWNAGHRLR